jgi:hypothetical protein
MTAIAVVTEMTHQAVQGTDLTMNITDNVDRPLKQRANETLSHQRPLLVSWNAAN